MAGGDLSALDWRTPWFAPWHEPGEAVAARVAAGAALHDSLNACGGGEAEAGGEGGGEGDGDGRALPVRFVPQQHQQLLPDGRPYESFIFDTGCCPVRPGLHDFFNGLCWIAFARSKRALNRLQAQAIAQDGVGPRRGPVRDAITLFDENGALLQAPPALWDALTARAWRRLFVELRPLWREARLMLFGHAMLEQLARPRKNLTVHVWREPCPTADIGEADAWLAQRLDAGRLASKPFTPLPVMGIPGWDAGSENFSFYDDSLVFRSPRAPESMTTPMLPVSRCRGP